jgi:hypothetical protein
MSKYSLIVLAFMVVMLGNKKHIPQKDSLFSLQNHTSTNIDFKNNIDDTSDYNFFNLKNIFGGAGVCIGDINNDGLSDIFFSANNSNCKLYLNKGDFVFEDISLNSGINIKGGWVTGVIMADINGDGYMDIYLSRTDTIVGVNSENLFFENQGNNTFIEKAKEYGINDSGLTTQASFFDMDNDGDLDLFVLNTPLFDNDPNDFTFLNADKSNHKTSDKLYKNIDGKFIDVTLESGFEIERGSGLGVLISDINMDGWLDIYVANDWIENDKLYINQKGGTFKESLKNFASTTSYFSMGLDIADINNDGWPDVFVADMAPDNHYRRNILINQASVDFYYLQEKNELINQVSRNTLQINKEGKSFVEIGELSGLARTDWTWSALLFDIDNDGLKDLFLGNGNKRDIGNMDVERMMFEKFDDKKYKYSITELADIMPLLKTKNYFFKNTNGLEFKNKSELWDNSDTVNTQGAAYADLNNDGTVDLVLNNTDDYASILKNNSKNNFIRLKLNGEKKNTQGLGAKAWIFYEGQMQYSELTNARGFQSSSENILHFGLGNNTKVDSLIVVFLSGKYSVIKNVRANQTLDVKEKNALSSNFNFEKIYPKNKNDDNLKTKQTTNIPFLHKETYFSDFKEHKLLHRKYSKLGPAIAVGDINNDGLDDVFIGGAYNQKSSVFIQGAKENFIPIKSNDIYNDSLYEDIHAELVDLNNDSHLDLIIASGSFEHFEQANLFSVRIYFGDGSGQFINCNDCVPSNLGFISTILPLDFDNDKNIDLFLGGRVSLNGYGQTPKSFILKNNGYGKFFDVTTQTANEISTIGMVTCAKYEDINNDDKKELILCGEWMPISVFSYSKNQFNNTTKLYGLENSYGWWNTIHISDVNKNGRKDIIAGNFGYNSIFKPSITEPIVLLVNDFDNSKKTNAILTLFLRGKQFTYHGRNLICSSMPMYFNKFLKYETFASYSIEELFSTELYENAIKLKANELKSGVFIQDKTGKFDFKAFPDELQFAPINTIQDFNNGTYYVAGNFNQFIYELGNIKSLSPTWFTINENNDISITRKDSNNLKVTNQSKKIKINNYIYVVNANNNDSLTLYQE